MKTNFNWGIIGCGQVTEIKSGPAFQMVEGFNLTAVMRRDEEKARDYALRHKVPLFFSDANALINHPEIDAVYIATPPDSHLYYALKVARVGKICCIEKPMTPSYSDCVLINKAFDREETPLFVSYYRRSLPRFNKIKSWIETSQIGEIRHVNWHLSRPVKNRDYSNDNNWRTQIDVAYGGYFDDLASHGIDLFIYLLGDIIKATGVSINQQGLYSAMDSVAGSWIHKSGITGSGSWNFGSEKSEDFIQIYGDQGKITFSMFGNDPLVLEQGNQKELIRIDNPNNIQLHHVQNMREHLLGNSKHPSTGHTAAHTSWVMDKILKENF